MLLICAAHCGFAQFFLAPHIGFKSYALEGATSSISQGYIDRGPLTDAGTTAFHVGVGIGSQIYPEKSVFSIYNLDLILDVSYVSAGFFEAGYNYSEGAGSFSANGLTGARTNHFSFDLMPMHRFRISQFDVLSPYGGLGISFNIFSTNELKGETGATAKGGSEFHAGLNIFYGSLIRIADRTQLFLQLKHLIPFADKFTAIDDSRMGKMIIQDAPGYFNLSAGFRFTF